MQSSILSWLTENPAILMVLILIIMIILLVIYCKMFVDILPDSTHYRLYRKGKLIREANGGIIVRIPFFDRLEIDGEGDIPSLEDRWDPLEKAIRKERVVDAGIDDVWEAWTTHDGVTSFFAPEAKVEFRIGGAYEMYFAPDSEPGSRGGEGNRILSYLPKEMLSFEWNAPPSFPEERKIKTYVVVQLKDEGFGNTRVILTHHGWGKGGNWDSVFDYFQNAWDIVLDNLVHRFSEGPIDWDSL